MTRRLFLSLRQSKFGTSHVPYSATWIKVSKARLAKFTRTHEEFNTKILRISEPTAAGSGGGGRGASLGHPVKF